MRPLQHGDSVASRRSISVCSIIVIGTGLLKPNVSVLVGQLYRAGRHPARRGLLDLSTWASTRGAFHLAARLRVSRSARELAHRVCRGWRRHGARRRAVACSAAGTSWRRRPAPAPAEVSRGRCHELAAREDLRRRRAHRDRSTVRACCSVPARCRSRPRRSPDAAGTSSSSLAVVFFALAVHRAATGRRRNASAST